MEYDTKVPQSVTSDVNSFANESVRTRWPVILTGAIDDVHRTLTKSDNADVQQEGKKIIEQLANLKYEVLHDRKLTPVEDDGFSDEVAAYNKEIADRGDPTWMDVSWLFAECYMYRRIATYFARTQHWKNYDIFARQKLSTFRSSRSAVVELAGRYKQLVTQLKEDKSETYDIEKEKTLFMEMMEVCLWGNATDLSLLTSLTYEDIQKLQGSKARKAAEKNILVNDLPAAYEILRKARENKPNEERRVDIVLDNAGFELYVDLILAGFLLTTKLATQIILRPKSIPWFVSDVLPQDFSATLSAIADARAFFETQSEDEALQGKTPEKLSDEEAADLDFVFQHWSTLHSEGEMTIRPDRYWTRGGSFWRLPAENPALHDDLRPAELVLFKGDLNYRKLTGDAHWDTTTPFTEALGPIGPSSGLNVLSLRTCKADVVVALPKGKDEELKAMEGGGGDSGARKWAWHGKWAVVCLSQGRQ